MIVRSNVCCKKCDSDNVMIDNKGSQNGLYCKDCGSWIKWISKKDLNDTIEYINNKNTIATVAKEPNLKQVVDGDVVARLQVLIEQREFHAKFDYTPKNDGIIIGLKMALAIVTNEY